MDDFKQNYQTSQMYQNKDMSPECLRNTYKMDNKKKQELSKANFKFGNYSSDFYECYERYYKSENQFFQ